MDPITINTASRIGTGSFSVAPGESYQWLVPKNSGARLTSTGGESFTALAAVGATPSANNAFDWGFTLVPEDGLTTLAVVGWGPGSSDDSKNLPLGKHVVVETDLPGYASSDDTGGH